MVALLARLGRTADVGAYSLGLALTAPLFLLLGLQLRSVQATDARTERPFAQYFSLRALGMGLGLALTVGLALLYPQARAVLGWLGVAKALEGLSDVAYGLMQQRERLDWVARSTLLRGLLGLGLLGTAFALSGSVALGAAGVALANLLVLVLYDLPHTRRLAPGRWWTPHIPGALLRIALPLGLVMGLVSLGSTLPRLFVERTLGTGALGLYSALAYLNVAGSVIVVALGTAVTARLSQRYAAGDRRGFVALTLGMTGAAAVVGGGLVLLAMVGGGPLLRLLYGPEYAAQSAPFVWLMVSGALGYLASCAGFAVTAARKFGEQLPLFVVVTGVLALACWTLVPAHGLVGAALASLLAAGVQLLGSWGIVAWALGTPVPDTSPLGTPAPGAPPPTPAPSQGES
ncbi:polysaccharide biosynthesis protein [Deinococcus phoenicis]|uniref:Polysaccharide biosynthesis protein n=2 Tax=Deinococcus phoenicis TaxID=1476583 RepID=A0A016QUC3_9DEIO|nr:polysaccharide biosynthesis protein [Deinococcus phoenicis]